MTNATSPRDGVGNAVGCAGALIAGRTLENFEQSLGRAGSRRDLAPHLREFAERAGREHREQHELAEPAGRDLLVEHVLRADPQHHDHA